MTKKLKITSSLVLLLLMAALVVFTGCGSQTKPVTESQIADLNDPAEVYIVTTHEGDVTVPVLTYNIDALVNAVVGQILSGQAGSSEAAIEDALIKELIARAGSYIIPSTQRKTQSLSVTSSGNGFIISPDGFVITNAHIVKTSEEDLKEEFAIEVIAEQLVSELPVIEQKLGFELTEAEIDQFFEAAATIIADKVTISDPASKTQVYPGNIIDKARKEEGGLSAEMVRVGDPLDLKKETGKDVAVLKVNASELPTVKLGDESSVRDGDKITSVTFISSKAEEGAGTSEVPKEDTPSLVTGTVSGLRRMSDGWSVLQMQIPLKPGASGSPIFNSNGEVVGMETFVSVETQAETGQQTPVETQNYAIPISVIKEFMSLANVSSSEGTAGLTYRQGVDLFSEEHYSAAKKKFEDVRNTNPDFPYIQDMITESQNNINKGLDKGTFPVLAVLILVLIVIVIIAVVLIVLLVILPRSRRKKGGGGGGMGGPGYGPPGPGGPGAPYGPGMAPGPPGMPGTQPPPADPGTAAPGGPPPAGPGPAAPGGAPPMPGSPGDTGNK